ncbi:hypothetical protein L6R49_21020 [Myxococcota bacterium]|nr:hypothetical protein [Myxococcota bacterium]
MSRPPPISIRGAREHNLQGVTLDLPRGELIVLSGPSGSGKSSLAWDTLYAEARRRYAETMTGRARGSLDLRLRPKVESVTGLPPTLGVGQRIEGTSGAQRVGELTDLRELLIVRLCHDGVQRCPTCGDPVRAWRVDEVVAALMGLPEGATVSVLAPLLQGVKGGHKALLDGLLAEGYARARIDGVVERLDELGPLDARAPHTIELVIDRIRVAPDRAERLYEATRAAWRVGGGRLIALTQDGETVYAESPWCARCGLSLPRAVPTLFTEGGAGDCPTCRGAGEAAAEDALIADPRRSIRDGALPAIQASDRVLRGLTLQALDALGVPLDLPFGELDEDQRALVLDGLDEPIVLKSARGDARSLRFEGVRALPAARRSAGGPCAACGGSGLSAVARAITLGGLSLAALESQPLRQLTGTLAGFVPSAEMVTLHDETRRRLDALMRCGLGHLSLGRRAGTLSTGELRRLRLGAVVGGELSGVLYVLDEPSVGLPDEELPGLIDLLRSLRDQNNTVLVVDHHPALIAAAGWCVDFGPGAGAEGGRVLFEGPPAALGQAPTPTGYVRSGQLPAPVSRRRGPGPGLTLRGARGHNLQGDPLHVPLGRLGALYGPTGGGKRSLLFGTLRPALAQVLGLTTPPPLPFEALDGGESITRLVTVEGRAPGGARSLVATWSGLYDSLRDLWAQTREAKALGLSPGHFSLHVPGGRCETCKGQGQLSLARGPLPDAAVTCPACQGRRFDPPTLTARYRGLNPHELLEQTVRQARAVLAGHPVLDRHLRLLEEVGLGYLRLGQPTASLSGGEAQRLRLARDLTVGAAMGGALYLIDSPSSGLHPLDLGPLLAALQRLVDEGATVVVIDQHPWVRGAADWTARLEGGRIVG